MPTGKSTWDIIGNYEAHELVRTRYLAKHGCKPSAAHAREIAAPFTQARHYYAAAANSDRTVKPLLLYYGVVSLSRGLVLFLNRKLRDASLAQSHGLSALNWQTVISADKPDLADLTVTVNGSGSFVELLKATQYRSLLRSNTSAINHKTTNQPVPAGTLLTLGELLETLPDVIDQLQRWRTPRCVPYTVAEIEGSDEVTITVPRWRGSYVDDGLVIDIFGSKHCSIISMDEGSVIVRTKNGSFVDGFVTDLIDDRFGGIGSLYLAKTYTLGISLSKIAQLFAVSYLFSMIVRYHPTFWMDFVYQRIGDAALPTVLKVIDCIETLYPQMIVDFLEEE